MHLYIYVHISMSLWRCSILKFVEKYKIIENNTNCSYKHIAYRSCTATVCVYVPVISTHTHIRMHLFCCTHVLKESGRREGPKMHTNNALVYSFICICVCVYISICMHVEVMKL